MAYVNAKGYVIKKLHKIHKRIWFVIKARQSGRAIHNYTGFVGVGVINFPKKMVGKKIRLKVEVV